MYAFTHAYMLSMYACTFNITINLVFPTINPVFLCWEKTKHV